MCPHNAFATAAIWLGSSKSIWHRLVVDAWVSEKASIMDLMAAVAKALCGHTHMWARSSTSAGQKLQLGFSNFLSLKRRSLLIVKFSAHLKSRDLNSGGSPWVNLLVLLIVQLASV